MDVSSSSQGSMSANSGPLGSTSEVSIMPTPTRSLIGKRVRIIGNVPRAVGSRKDVESQIRALGGCVHLRPVRRFDNFLTATSLKKLPMPALISWLSVRTPGRAISWLQDMRRVRSQSFANRLASCQEKGPYRGVNVSLMPVQCI